MDGFVASVVIAALVTRLGVITDVHLLSSGNFAIFAAIRRALAGCTPGAAIKRRPTGQSKESYILGRYGYRHCTATGTRQLPHQRDLLS